MRDLRSWIVVVLCIVSVGCAPKAVPAAEVQKQVQTAFDQKMRWILELEDARQLRGGGGDLLTLLNDAEPRVRRRAALAAGRVKLADALPPLTSLLQSDPDPDVRQMAAFAMGLIGDASAAVALSTALTDADPMIQGRAAEALGLIAHKAAAPAIAAMVTPHIKAGALEGIAADDMGWPKAPAAEAVRLGVYALVRLASYDALASAVLADGRPVSRWWPIAYALQRINDARAVPALLDLLKGDGQLTRAFAARGLGQAKAQNAAPALVAIAENAGEATAVRVQAIRSLALLGERSAAAALRRLIVSPKIDQNLQLEAVTALAQLRSPEVVELLIDLVSASWASVRAAALRALANTDVDTFMSALSGLDPDQHWSVRAALASTLGDLGRERAQAPLTSMLRDADQRVLPSVLDALAKVGATNALDELTARLTVDDPVVRAAAARGLATLKAAKATPLLLEAIKRAQGDGIYVARTAALDALVAIDPAAAKPALTAALSDRDWAVRVRAAEHLKRLDASADVSSMRPAPPHTVAELTAIDALVNPPYSPQAYIDTAKGTIQVELAILDAPRTVANFMSLVRRNYFRGVQLHRVVPDFVVQDGDPRGDGEGGPGYTIRDEINMRPYLRGAVGMALDWPDTGGSQFFITHSPQPHLDGRYTVFGQVISGMDVVDRLQQWDTIDRIRVWDGVAWIGDK
ncbi:MAG TPA: HEAT repeat domain-containing protein [Vicinamibacterales bacterium]|nr:HEAT repeat domain-containing protein [Vicinamibacterales bacterium]